MTQRRKFGCLALLALALVWTACVSEPPTTIDVEREAVAAEASAGDPELTVPVVYEEIPPRTRAELDRLLAPQSGPSPKVKCGGSIAGSPGHIIAVGCTDGKQLCYVSLWWDLDDPADAVCKACKGKSCMPW
jgi:hypothetical protein